MRSTKVKPPLSIPLDASSDSKASLEACERRFSLHTVCYNNICQVQYIYRSQDHLRGRAWRAPITQNLRQNLRIIAKCWYEHFVQPRQRESAHQAAAQAFIPHRSSGFALALYCSWRACQPTWGCQAAPLPLS